MKNVDQEVKRQFAKDQVDFLREHGIRDNERISRIFKAAGPGQIQEAWHLAKQADTPRRKDLLDCLLTGVQGSQDFGWRRMALVLTEAGFEPPNATSSHSFFRILDGALEILVPGGYELTGEELANLEAKLGHPRKYQREEEEESQEDKKTLVMPEDDGEDIEYLRESTDAVQG